MPGILYKFEAWSVTYPDETKLRVFENKFFCKIYICSPHICKIYGLVGDRESKERRIRHKLEIHDRPNRHFEIT